MATLKAIYENETDIPAEAVTLGLYEEKDGKHVLKRDAIEGVKTQADVAAVQVARDKEKKDRVAAEAKLKKFEKLGDKDPEELLGLADEVESLKAQVAAGGKGGASEEVIKAQVDARVRTETAKLQRAFDALKTEAEGHKATAGQLSEKMKKSTIDTELQRVALAAKVRPEAIPDFLLHRGMFDISDDGKVVTKDGVGVTPGMDAESLLIDMKATRSHWWPDSVGGGAKGGTGGGNPGNNPFHLDTPNATAAGMLMQSDPAKAATLAKMAGHASPAAGISALARAAVGIKVAK